MTTVASTFLIGFSPLFYVTRTTIKAWMSLKFSKIQPGTYELAALEHLGKIPHRLIVRENVVTTPVPSLLIGSSSFLQVTWTPINSPMGLKFGQVGLWTVELQNVAALERLENLHRLIMGEML